MKIENVVQGSPEWHDLRAKHFTASEAPAMMGVSPYMTRDELLRQKATGVIPEVSDHQQALFDRGHQAEADTREIIEAERDEEFYPVTGTLTVEGLKLLASMDGINIEDTLIFEHKLWNGKLIAEIKANGIPESHYWQLEHQMLVSGVAPVLFVVWSVLIDSIIASAALLYSARLDESTEPVSDIASEGRAMSWVPTASVFTSS